MDERRRVGFFKNEGNLTMATMKLAGGNDDNPASQSTSPPPIDPLDEILSLTPGKPNTPAGEICIYGELIHRDDYDSLIDAYEKLEAADRQIYSAKCQIRQALADAVKDGTGKTRRVQGHRRKAIVEMPSDGWDQSQLKSAWNAYPQLREQCMKIGTIDVMIREFKKLETTAAATPDVGTFKTMIEAAKKPATALPSVKIEV